MNNLNESSQSHHTVVTVISKLSPFNLTVFLKSFQDKNSNIIVIHMKDMAGITQVSKYKRATRSRRIKNKIAIDLSLNPKRIIVCIHLDDSESSL